MALGGGTQVQGNMQFKGEQGHSLILLRVINLFPAKMCSNLFSVIGGHLTLPSIIFSLIVVCWQGVSKIIIFTRLPTRAIVPYFEMPSIYFSNFFSHWVPQKKIKIKINIFELKIKKLN